MTDPNCRRRAVLRGAGAAATTLAAGSTAGCLGLSSETDWTYSDWLPVPSRLGNDDRYRFVFDDHEDRQNNEEHVPADEFGTGYYLPYPFEYRDVSKTLYFESMLVYEAAFDKAEVLSSYEDSDRYEKRGEAAGYEIYQAENLDGTGICVGSDRFMFANAESSMTPAERVRVLHETRTESTARHVDEDEDVRALVDALGDGSRVTGTFGSNPYDDPEAGLFADMVGSGEVATIDGATTDVKWVVVYESESDLVVDDLQRWVDSDDRTFEGVSDISVETSGRVGTITGTAQTGEFF